MAEAGRALPGRELARAFRTVALYTLALIYLGFGISVSISLVHEVIQLQEIGFSPKRAGEIWGILLGSTILARPSDFPGVEPQEPILDLQVFALPLFSTAVFLITVHSFMLFSTGVLIPVFLQEVMG